MKKIRLTVSWLIWKISGHRILTPSGAAERELQLQERARRIKENNERIQAMQDELDAVHRRLRGWTSKTASQRTEQDPMRDIELKHEFQRTREAMGFFN